MADAAPAPADIDLEQVTRDLISALPEDIREKSNDTFEALQNGATFGDMNGIDDRKLEMVYSVARTYYNNKKYDDALTMFRFITLMDHSNQKFWMGYAGTLQMMKEYEKAVEAYGFATILDIDLPKPQLQAGYCLMQLGKDEEAICAFEGVLLIDDLDVRIKLQAEAFLANIRRAERDED